MIRNISKEKSLLKLREFCSNPPQGMISYWWFNGLVNCYPLQFLFYSQFSTKFVGTKKTSKEKIVSNFDIRIRKVLEYPIGEKEIKIIEKMWDDLDTLIENNKKEMEN